MVVLLRGGKRVLIVFVVRVSRELVLDLTAIYLSSRVRRRLLGLCGAIILVLIVFFITARGLRHELELLDQSLWLIFFTLARDCLAVVVDPALLLQFGPSRLVMLGEAPLCSSVPVCSSLLGGTEGTFPSGLARQVDAASRCDLERRLLATLPHIVDYSDEVLPVEPI